jgi:hypothetical protein
MLRILRRDLQDLEGLHEEEVVGVALWCTLCLLVCCDWLNGSAGVL